MQRSPVTAWQELSELYEQADALEGPALQAWLAAPALAGHAQLEALRRMLAAREQLRHSDFMNTGPRLDAGAAAAGIETAAMRAGAAIGPYRLLAPLGAGGMAEVWLAERSDGAFQRRVAIKLMFRQIGSAARDSVAQRFARERDILASLDHPNIAALHDAGVTPDGQPWLALEYIEGRPLTDWCDAATLGIAGRVRLFRQVLQAVQHAHAQLVMHRDLKPANILVGSDAQVHLLDFGIAKLLEPGADARADTELTRAAGHALTPLYASPEQLRGEPLTIACDVYALGVVLYELLCGERPYEPKADSAVRLEQAILEADPRAPSRRALRAEAAAQRDLGAEALRKALRGDLDAIVLQALAKQPARRYASADAMLADIDRWLEGEPVKAHPPSALYRWGKFVRRNRLAVGLSAAAGLALAGVAALAVIQGQQAQRESARAVAARDFMIDMFKRADAAKSRGADITAREMLDSGHREVLQRLAAQPALQAELLQAIGSIQYEMGEYLTSDRTYDEATRLFERRGDARGAAAALAEHAQVAYQLGDFDRTLGLIERARSLRGRGGSVTELDVQLDWLAGLAHTRRAEEEAARSLLERSLREATRILGPHHARTIDALQGLSLLAAQRQDYAAALAVQDDIAARLGAAAPLPPRERAQIRHKRIHMLLLAGRAHEAFRQADGAARSCAQEPGLGDETCREIVIQKVVAALRLGHAEAVRGDLAVLSTAAGEEYAPDLQLRSLLWLCRARAALDTSRVDPALAERLVRIATSGEEVKLGADAKMGALLALADASLRVGLPVQAQQRAEQALASVHAPAAAVSTRAWARHLVGVALAAQGRSAASLDALRASQRDYELALGTQHPMVLLYSLNLAVALEALGQRDEARRLVARAGPVLRDALGEDSPTYGAVRLLQRRLESVPPPGTRGDVPVPQGGPASPLFI